MSVVKIRHPQYGYVEFHNMSLRQMDVLQMLKRGKSLESSSKKRKFASNKTNKNGN